MRDEVIAHKDEVSIRQILRSLPKYTKFIFFFVAIPTLIALYNLLVFEVPPQTYKAQNEFVPPTLISVLNVNRFNILDETRQTIFANFLTKITSKSLQKKVFFQSNILSRMNLESESLDFQNKFASDFVNKVGLKEAVVWDPNLKDEYQEAFINKIESYYERPYSLETIGENPSVISDYLDNLFIAANKEINQHYIDLTKSTLKFRLGNIDNEIAIVTETEKNKRLTNIAMMKNNDNVKIKEITNEINRIKDRYQRELQSEIGNLKFESNLSKNIGSLDGNLTYPNFQQLFYNQSTSGVNYSDEKKVVNWTLYGEKILDEKIKLLMKRQDFDIFIPELSQLLFELDAVNNNVRLETIQTNINEPLYSFELSFLKSKKNRLEYYQSLNNFEVFNGSEEKSSSTIIKIPPNHTSPILILLIVFFGSLILSIFLSLMYNFLRDDNNTLNNLS